MELGQRNFSFDLNSETKQIVLKIVCERKEEYISHKVTQEQVLQLWKFDKNQMKEDWKFATEHYVPEI